MKPLIIKLPELNAVIFEGFGPGCEVRAFGKMKNWLKKYKSESKNYRIFGHNIDSQGDLTWDHQHTGYKLLLVIDNDNNGTDGPETSIISPGKFLVTRTEGKLNDVGQWLMEGWRRVNKVIIDEKLELKNPARWFEEHIRTPDSDYVIVDLYIEIE